MAASEYSILRRIVVPGTDDSPSRDMGIVKVTEEGITWHTYDGHLIYRATWVQWALQMTLSGVDFHGR